MSMNDVQATLARLESRSRQLVFSCGDSRVIRNARSLCAASQNVLNATASNTAASQAATELYMANAVGFDLQDQQRLLRQIVENRVICPPVTEEPVMDSAAPAVDLEAFLAARRAEALRQAARDAHERINATKQERTEHLIAQATEMHTARMAEMLGMQSLRLTDVDGPKPSSSFRSVKALKEAKIRAYANIISTVPVREWGHAFAQTALELAENRFDDPIVLLWSTAQAIAAPLLNTPGSDDCSEQCRISRGVLEEKYLMQIFVNRGTSANLYEELCLMPPRELQAEIERSCGDRAPLWKKMYKALRAGCPEVAVLIAEKGNSSGVGKSDVNLFAEVITALKCNQVMEWRDYSRLLGSVDGYWYAAAVLLVLSRGKVSSDVTGAVISTVVENVAESAEDCLWLRLCLVECAPQIGTKSPLEGVQDMLQQDEDNVLASVNHDVIQFASLHLHALLPSVAVRLLLGCEDTFVDGVHIAMLYCAAGDKGGLMNDIGPLLRRYSTMLLEVPRRNEESRQPAQSILDYFTKCNAVDAFVEFCQCSAVVVRLFGRIDGTQGREGELTGPEPTESYLELLIKVAQGAVERGKSAIATHMYILTSRAAIAARRKDIANQALTDAVRSHSAAMFRAIHADSHGDVLQVANILHTLLLDDPCDVPVHELDAMRTLRAMLMIHTLARNGDEDRALNIVRMVPFIPQTVGDVDGAVYRYHDRILSDDVHTVMPATALLIMRLYQSAFHRSVSKFDRASIRDSAQALLLWVMRWRRKAVKEVLDELTNIQRLITVA